MHRQRGARPRRAAHIVTTVLAVLCLTWAGCTSGGGSNPPEANPSTGTNTSTPLQANDSRLGLIVGYQGWFGCPGDFEDNRSWIHWFNGSATPEQFTVDLLPDTTGLAESDTCDTGLLRADGQPLRVYSSLNPQVVDAHLRQMAAHGVTALALQRFVVQLDQPRLVRRMNQLLALVRQAAERHGVGFFISYDVSGADPATVLTRLRADWQALSNPSDALNPLASSAYVRVAQRPVLQLWGFGFTHNPGQPDEVLALLNDLRQGSGGLPASHSLGGVPSQWRNRTGDAQTDAAWAEVYRHFDTLSPWLVGRFDNNSAVRSHYAQVAAADLVLTRARGQAYLPVVFPGFSWHQLMRQRGLGAQAPVNQIPRRCGTFFQTQITALRAQGVGQAYVAMFDEFDEGTAMLPAAASPAEVPASYAGLWLGQEACSDGGSDGGERYLNLLGWASQQISSR